MVVPLVILALGSALGMLLNNSIQTWLAHPPVTAARLPAVEILAGWVTLVLVLVGVGIAYLMYRGEISYEQPAPRTRSLHRTQRPAGRPVQ